MSDVEPGARAEENLLAAFRIALRNEALAAGDDLLAGGASSLAVARALVLAAELGVQVPAALVGQARTVRAIAAALGPGTVQPVPATAPPGWSPLPPTAQFLLAQGGLDEHDTIGGLWEIAPGQLDAALLAAALGDVLAAAPSLGLRLERTRAGLMQTWQPHEGASLVERVDMPAAPPAEFALAVRRVLQARRAFLFEPQAPLLRAILFAQGGAPRRLFIGCHRLLLDGAGFRMLLRELTLACRARLAQRPYRCAASPQPAAAWAGRLVRYANGAAMAELPYWRGLPWERYAGLALRAGYRADALAPVPRDELPVTATLPAQETALFLALPAWRQHDALLLAVAQAMQELTGESSFLLDSVHALRGAVFGDFDTSRLLAAVSELVPVPVRLRAAGNRRATLDTVAARRAAVPMHGLGYRALRHLCAEGVVVQEARRWAQPRVAVDCAVALQRDWPERLFDLAPAPEWPGPPSLPVRMSHWLSFSLRLEGSVLALQVRRQPRLVSQAAAQAASRCCIHWLARIAEGFGG